MTDVVVDLVETVEPNADRVDGQWLRAFGTGTERSDVQDALNNAEAAFAALQNIVRDRFNTAAAKEQFLSAPDYSVQCAHAAGYKQALREVFKLITNTTLKTPTGDPK